MPRRDDDEFEDDDRPRRRPRDDDEDDDRPARGRRPRDDDEDDDRPRRRRPADDEDEDLAPPRKKKKSNLLLILGIVGGILLLCCGGGIGGLWYAGKKMGGAAERITTSNDLKQVGIGCHNHLAVHGTFPTNSYSAEGRPLLSWRVHILPFVEEEALYRQFNLNEPWDSQNNRRLLDQMPMVYATPQERAGRVPKGNKTYIRGFSSPGAFFERRPGAPGMPNFPGPMGKGGFEPPVVAGLNPIVKGLTINQILDGTSNTIIALEAGSSVEWTKPDDLDASPGKPFPSLGGIRPNDDTVIVLFADASVRPVKRTNPEPSWRAAVTYAGAEAFNLE